MDELVERHGIREGFGVVIVEVHGGDARGAAAGLRNGRHRGRLRGPAGRRDTRLLQRLIARGAGGARRPAHRAAPRGAAAGAGAARRDATGGGRGTRRRRVRFRPARARRARPSWAIAPAVGAPPSVAGRAARQPAEQGRAGGGRRDLAGQRASPSSPGTRCARPCRATIPLDRSRCDSSGRDGTVADRPRSTLPGAAKRPELLDKSRRAGYFAAGLTGPASTAGCSRNARLPITH